MAQTSFYDAIVVGGDLAGTIAGGLLRRQKYRVLVIGQAQGVTSYAAGGAQVPAMPLMLPPYGHAPVLDEVLKDVGVEDPVHTLGLENGTPLQIVTRDQRIDLSANRHRLARELQRAFPDQKVEFLKVLKNIESADEQLRQMLQAHPPVPPEGLKEKVRFKRLTRADQSIDLPPPDQWPPLLQVLAAATTFISHLEPKKRSHPVTGHLVLALLRGLRVVPDLSDRLQKTLKKSGVEIQPRAVVEEILFDGKNISGVKTIRGSGAYNCSTLIAGMPIREALEIVPPRRRHRRFRLAAETVRPVSGMFVLNLVVPEEALPLGMAKQLILARDPTIALEEENLIRLLCLPYPERKGHRLLSCCCRIPYRKRALGREYLGPLEQKVFEAVAELVPFLDEHLKGRSSPFWSSRSGDEGHPAPWSLHPVFETEQEVIMGSCVLPLRTPYRNMFYCGPEAIPGLGMEGVAYAARETARLVHEKRKLKKIL
jgi:phytoene dehydrogenase-like protein